VAGRYALTVQVTAGDAPLLKSARAKVATMRTIFGQPDGAAAEAQLLAGRRGAAGPLPRSFGAPSAMVKMRPP
jgi:hypothetical protein